VAVIAVAIVVAVVVAAAVVADRLRTVSVTDAGIERSELASGVRVVSERMPEARSVSIGMWFGVGSRDEPASIAGASHFLEHLLFKGTEDRSARSIAAAVDAVGGEMNAYTSREHTAYYLRLPVGELREGLALLADVVSAPAFRPDELDAEREVIIEELLMSEDTPDDLVITSLYADLFTDHPLGRETLGDHDTVTAMRREDISEFHSKWYRPSNLVVAAAGDLHHDVVVDALGDLFGGGPAGARPQRSLPTEHGGSLVQIDRPIEQVHVAMGWRGLPLDSDDRYALWVANHVLGGGMSSRLFQEIRETRGLAYTVFSSPSSYSDCGSFLVYAGTAMARLDDLVDVTQRVLTEFVEHGITDEEHRIALGYLEGSMLLGLEDSGSRMARLGNGLIARDDITSVDEHVRRIRAVTPADVSSVARRLLEAPRTVSAVGPLGDGSPALDRLVAG